MSDFSALINPALTAGQLMNRLEHSADATSVLGAAQQLIEEFGINEIGGAFQNLTLAQLAAALKDMIATNHALPESIKELAYDAIDSAVADATVTTSSEAADAVEAKLGEEASHQADMQNRMIEDQANKNDEDNGAGSTEGKKSSRSGGDGNWLENLAAALGRAQSAWIEKAEGHLAVMEAEAGSDDSKAFTEAQAKYSASMQMFSMTAAASATSIKTIGEGLSGIARKQ